MVAGRAFALVRLVLARAEVRARARLTEDRRLALPAGVVLVTHALVALTVDRQLARAAVRTRRVAVDRHVLAVVLRPDKYGTLDDPGGFGRRMALKIYSIL